MVEGEDSYKLSFDFHMYIVVQCEQNKTIANILCYGEGGAFYRSQAQLFHTLDIGKFGDRGYISYRVSHSAALAWKNLEYR